MTPEEVSDFLLELPEATQDEPFGPGVYAYKVSGKVFAILGDASAAVPNRVTLKCDPALALHLRETFPAVSPGYHTNKRHWNTVILDGTVPREDLQEMLEHSYDRVIANLTKAVRDRLNMQRDTP